MIFFWNKIWQWIAIRLEILSALCKYHFKCVISPQIANLYSTELTINSNNATLRLESKLRQQQSGGSLQLLHINLHLLSIASRFQKNAYLKDIWSYRLRLGWVLCLFLFILWFVFHRFESAHTPHKWITERRVYIHRPNSCAIVTFTKTQISSNTLNEI